MKKKKVTPPTHTKAHLPEPTLLYLAFSFLSSTIPQFLAGQTEENRVYSPLSLYMALAMLAELTDGNSRQQVLDLLDVPDL